jgi:hypothetical protein
MVNLRALFPLRWLLCGSLALLGCDDISVSACADEQQQLCPCANGSVGVQSCESGNFGPCDCEGSAGGSSGSAGKAGAGSSAGKAGASGSAGASQTPKHSPGESCSPEGTLDCSTGQNVLVCVLGKYHLQTVCKSPQTCFDNTLGDRIQCGTSAKDSLSYAISGTECFAENSGACSLDGRNLLGCVDGRWETQGKCPASCGLVGSNLLGCVAIEVGAPCQEYNRAACGVEKSSVLRCNGQKFEKLLTCPGGLSCKDTNSQAVSCGTRPIAIQGGPCNNDGAACSADQKQFLACVSGKWLATENCSYKCDFLAPGESSGNKVCKSSTGCAGCLSK